MMISKSEAQVLCRKCPCTVECHPLQCERGLTQNAAPGRVPVIEGGVHFAKETHHNCSRLEIFIPNGNNATKKLIANASKISDLCLEQLLIPIN